MHVDGFRDHGWNLCYDAFLSRRFVLSAAFDLGLKRLPTYLFTRIPNVEKYYAITFFYKMRNNLRQDILS